MKFCITLICSLLLCSSISLAQTEIYRWVDTDGNVHYGDRPGNENAERLAITSKPTDRSAVRSMLQTRAADRAKAREAQQQAAQETAKNEAEERETAAERAEKCTEHRERLQSFLNSRRLYRETENGEREYLDDNEILAARERVQGKIEEYCTN